MLTCFYHYSLCTFLSNVFRADISYEKYRGIFLTTGTDYFNSDSGFLNIVRAVFLYSLASTINRGEMFIDISSWNNSFAA